MNHFNHDSNQSDLPTHILVARNALRSLDPPQYGLVSIATVRDILDPEFLQASERRICPRAQYSWKNGQIHLSPRKGNAASPGVLQ